jgi:hypothetical protein
VLFAILIIDEDCCGLNLINKIDCLNEQQLFSIYSDMPHLSYIKMACPSAGQQNAPPGGRAQTNKKLDCLLKSRN